MRYFILGDVHANIEALDAVLRDIKTFKPQFRKFRADVLPQQFVRHVPWSADKLVSVGDTVGYMANPNECLNKIFGISEAVLVGNHDRAVDHIVGGQALYSGFNSEALWAVQWTAEHLNDTNKKRLRALSEKMAFSFSEGNLVFAHSTPSSPAGNDYIFGRDEAFWSFFCDSQFKGKIAFVGHLHAPGVYLSRKDEVVSKSELEGGRVTFHEFGSISPQYQAYSSSSLTDCFQDGHDKPMQKTWDLSKYSSGLVVVPSVGQPRDRLNYTGYVIYDPDKKELIMRRVPYNFSVTQEKMRKESFPQKLIDRLAEGK
jgi:hypothetical protein